MEKILDMKLQVYATLMDKLIRQYLSKFKCAVVIDVNEYMNIAFKLYC